MTPPYDVTADDFEWALRVAKGFARRVPDAPRMAEEFESAAGLGLAQAASRFEAGRHGARFRTFAYPRVVGAIRDAMRESMPAGYGHSWAKRNPGAWSPATASIDQVIAVEDGTPLLARDAIPSGDGPVGWEAEYQDELLGLSRRLQGSHRAAFLAFYGRADGLRMKQTAGIVGVKESRVSQILAETSAALAWQFPDPGGIFMAGTGRGTGEGS